MKVFIALVFLFCPLASAFCGDRLFHGDLIRAAVRAAKWTRAQVNTTSLDHVVAAAFHSERLVGYRVPKYGIARLEAEIKRVGPNAITTGRIAYYVNGIVSACENPRNFSGYDLVERLYTGIKNYPVPGKFNHPFQYSLSVLALCIANASKLIENIPVETVILNSLGRPGALHGVDTVSMAVMALQCIQHDLKRNWCLYNIRNAVNKAIRCLLQRQKSDGSFGNSISTALAVQALLSADVKTRKWNCIKVMKFLLSKQQRAGSFQSFVMATAQVLPALIFATPQDVKRIECPKEPPVPSTVPITVCVRLEFLTNPTNGTPPPVPPQASVTVPNGTNTYTILTRAAQQHPCYRFTTKNTSFGRSIVSICGVAQDSKNKKYWLIFKDPKTLAPFGIDTFKPKDGSCVIFKYKKLSFR